MEPDSDNHFSDATEADSATRQDKVISPSFVQIATPSNQFLNVSLTAEDGRECAVLLLNDVRYHLERISAHELETKYRVDCDPDYKPQTDASGFCYLLVPFSRGMVHS